MQLKMQTSCYFFVTPHQFMDNACKKFVDKVNKDAEALDENGG